MFHCIEQIKKLTPKPVKYVVNTHFHWDHSQGNEAYLSAWPAGVEIISSAATRANLEQLGIPRWKHEIIAMPQEIEQLKSDLQKASSTEQKKSIQKKLVEAEAYFAELKNIQITLPTMIVDRRLILHRDSRWAGAIELRKADGTGRRLRSEACPRDCTVCGQQHVPPPIIHGKSRMRKRARTDLRGRRSAMVVPTATVRMGPSLSSECPATRAQMPR
jgi:hypothetical protein